MEFEGGENRGEAARAAAREMLAEDYHLLVSSCAHLVENVLEAVQANPAYDVRGFTVRETRALRDTIIPRGQFSRIARQEGGDDTPSPIQQAWAERSARDGR